MKQLNLIFALLFLLAFVSCEKETQNTSEVETPKEPCTNSNCSKDCATLATLGETIQGTIGDNGAYYYFNIEENGVLEIKTSNVPSTIRLRTTILNSNCGDLEYNSIVEDAGVGYTFAFLIPEPGAYVVKFDDRYQQNQGDFTFVANLNKDDAYENNQDCASAKEIELNQDIKAAIYPKRDEDNFKVNITETGVLKISVKNVPSDVRLRTTLKDYQCQSISNVLGPDNGVGYDYTNLVEPGEYIINFKPWLTSQSSPDTYTFNVSLDKSDKYESNNSCNDAAIISINEEISGAIYPKKDSDFYTFEIKEDGILKFEAFDVPSNIRLEAKIYNDKCQYTYYSRRSPDTGAGYDFTYEVKKGTYTIELKDYLTSTENSDLYKFKLSMQ